MTATAPPIDQPLPVETSRAPTRPAYRATTGEGRVTGRGVAVALTMTVAVGAVLRLWGLGAHRLGYDEAFTAMVGRMPLGDLFAYLRAQDSHPPLDYLLRAPLARAGVDEFWFRLPSVACSVGALALFAWWMRRYGFAGFVATALVALSDFELTHGRIARMYSELELIGVLAAVLADAWLRQPRRGHAPAVGALVFVGLPPTCRCSPRRWFARTCRVTTRSRGVAMARRRGRGGAGWRCWGSVVPRAGTRRTLGGIPRTTMAGSSTRSAASSPTNRSCIRRTCRHWRRRRHALATRPPTRPRLVCCSVVPADWPRRRHGRRC
jgi:hypothetical protein